MQMLIVFGSAAFVHFILAVAASDASFGTYGLMAFVTSITFVPMLF